jgi:hypothetical protein
MKKILYFLILCTSVSIAQKNSDETNSVSCIPVASVCNPVTLDSSQAAESGIGITFVGLHQIQTISAAQSSTLQDFTCTDSTSLNIAQAYSFEVHTGVVYEESVMAWIDFSNDGVFDASEIVFHDSAVIHIHIGSITIPQGTLNTFTPIRMRVRSDIASVPDPTACNDLMYGHFEDYKIYYGVNIGVDEPGNKIQLSLNPNPFHESAMLVISGNESMKVREVNIYNSFGQIIRTEFISGGSSLKIERRDMPVGLYFYTVTGKGEIKASGKFIVE